VTLVPVAVMQIGHAVPPFSGALGPWGLAGEASDERLARQAHRADETQPRPSNDGKVKRFHGRP
jgi:hypothetical protein